MIIIPNHANCATVTAAFDPAREKVTIPEGTPLLINLADHITHRRRKFFSVKVAGGFSEGGRVCGFRFFGLGEGEVGFASFPGFGDFGEDARDESQE